MPSSYFTLLSSPPCCKGKFKAKTERKPEITPCYSYVAVRMAWCIHLQTTSHSHHRLQQRGARLVALRLCLPLFLLPAALPWNRLSAQQVIRSPRLSGCAFMSQALLVRLCRRRAPPAAPERLYQNYDLRFIIQCAH